MGRTVLPYSQVWEAERQRWQKFRRALRKEDQAHLDRLFESARLHLQAGVYASNPWPLESMLLSMLLEHQKDLIALRERLEQSGKSRNSGIKHRRGGPAVRPGRLPRLSSPRGFRLPLNPLKGLGRAFGGFRKRRARALCPSPKSSSPNPMQTTGWLFDLYPLRPHGVVVYHRERAKAAADR